VGVVAVLLSCLATLPVPQADAPDAKKVQEAIQKGVAYLRSQEEPCLKGADHVGRRMLPRELVLWTLINAGVSPKDPFYTKLFDDMVKDKLEATPPVALQAMCLEFLDRGGFQKRIASCAKFLVDNQGSDGAWSYGSPSIYVEDIDSDKRPLPRLPAAPMNPKVTNKISIKKDRDGEGSDLTNSFFAALGIRACSDAGMVFEVKTMELALKYWKDSCQGKGQDSGWHYDRAYQSTYPAAAASAVSAMLIYGNILGANLKKDPVVAGGALSLVKHWNGGLIDNMTGSNTTWLFREYGFYTVEVSQLFLGKESGWGRDWYGEGAKLLLEQQKPDGSWDSCANVMRLGGRVGRDGYISSPLWDTCFAVLFLTKGIKPLEFGAAKKK
jgi:hypothetical protein